MGNSSDPPEELPPSLAPAGRGWFLHRSYTARKVLMHGSRRMGICIPEVCLGVGGAELQV